MKLRCDPAVIFDLGGGNNVLLVEMTICRSTVKNEEWIFYEDGNVGFSPNMYVTSKSISSGSGVQDKISKKKGRRKKLSPKEHYEKRKLLREQFEERLAKKEYLKEQLEKSALAKEQNARRFTERYEASILKS